MPCTSNGPLQQVQEIHTGPSLTGYPLSSGLHKVFGLNNTTCRNICLSKAAVGDVTIVPLVHTVLAEFSYPDRNLYTTTRVIQNNSHKLPPCVIHLFQQTKLKERVNNLFGIDFPSRMSIESSIICRQLRQDGCTVELVAIALLHHGICDSCALHVIYQAPISVYVSFTLKNI